MATKVKNRPGPASLFRGKIRAPVSLTLTPAHHLKVQQNKQRLGLSRSDLIGLLIENHANTVSKEVGPFYFHLKCASSGDTRKPAVSSGTLYKTLCGRWVYDSIAADADCQDRWVTCPRCRERDPHSEFRHTLAPTFG
jgi:hypothetical protein